MKFRTGLITGLAAGYVLGAKAGRERYEQILDVVDKLRGNGRIEAVVEKAAVATEEPRRKARGAMGNGLRAASEAIRDRSTPP